MAAQVQGRSSQSAALMKPLMVPGLGVSTSSDSLTGIALQMG